MVDLMDISMVDLMAPLKADKMVVLMDSRTVDAMELLMAYLKGTSMAGQMVDQKVNKKVELMESLMVDQMES